MLRTGWMAIVSGLTGILGTLALLAVFIFWGAPEGGDPSALPYFAVVGVLLAVSAVLGVRSQR